MLDVITSTLIKLAVFIASNETKYAIKPVHKSISLPFFSKNGIIMHNNIRFDWLQNEWKYWVNKKKLSPSDLIRYYGIYLNLIFMNKSQSSDILIPVKQLDTIRSVILNIFIADSKIQCMYVLCCISNINDSYFLKIC